MSKKRIYEVAHELGVDNKQVLDAVRALNVEVKSHMNSIDEHTIMEVTKRIQGKKAAPKTDLKKKVIKEESRNTPDNTKNTSSKSVKKSDDGYRTVTINTSSKRTHGNYPDKNSDNKQNNSNRRNDQKNPHRKDSSRGQQDRDRSKVQNRPSYDKQNRSGYDRQDRNGQDRQNRQGYDKSNNRQGKGSQERQNKPGQDKYNRSNQGKSSEWQNRPTQERRRTQGQDRGDKFPQDRQNKPAIGKDFSPLIVDEIVPKKDRNLEQKKRKDKEKDYRKVYLDNSSTEDRKNRKNKKKNKKGEQKGQAKSLVSTAMAKDRDRVKQRNEQNRQQKERELEKAKASIASFIELDGPLTVKELSVKMGREVSEIIKKLMMLGVMATINQEIDVDTATLIAEDFGVEVKEVAPPEDPTEIEEIVDAPESLQSRPPVVTIMGHVDHGKTSLLDVIRKTNVTASEAGGITQHIGAYMVRYQGNKITFLDTPGHEAFTSMRLRGAQSTDIAVLVVAADDGVMPQTIEAINHAKSANIPILVAINKMDKPGAAPDKVKQQLSEHGLLPEEWGGDIIMVPVSAKKNEGIDDLLENILLVAEVMELKANPNRNAQGVVIEAQLDKGRGPVCTLLVQKGTLHVGDTIIAGTAFGKVRAMTNERGEKVKSAKPSMPVEVLGLSDVPLAGEVMDVVDDNTARSVAEKRAVKQRAEELKTNTKVTLDDIFQQIKEGELKELNIIIKADVQGSVEALRQSLEAIKNPEVRIVIVHSAVGAINESDVMLASASNAIIIGFNVRPDAVVRKSAEKESVDLRTYRVIYDAINDVEKAMVGMLAPEYKEVILGRAEVRQVISTPKAIVAGAYVTDGKMTNNADVRLIRDGIVIHEGHVDSLRRFKDEVKEVASGFECGISIEKYRDIKENDVIEAYVMEEIAPTSL